MITISANNTVSRNHQHIGSVSQEQAGTVFFTPAGERHELGRRIVLSAPDRAGWVELENALIERGVINA